MLGELSGMHVKFGQQIDERVVSDIEVYQKSFQDSGAQGVRAGYLLHIENTYFQEKTWQFV